jgi:hypothetical protein
MYFEIVSWIDNPVRFRPEILTAILDLILAASVHDLSDQHSKLQQGSNTMSVELRLLINKP